MIDSDGEEWFFNEKLPVISSVDIVSLPTTGYIGGTIIEINTEKGVVVIDTIKPHGIVSLEGSSTFTISIESTIFI